MKQPPTVLLRRSNAVLGLPVRLARSLREDIEAHREELNAPGVESRGVLDLLHRSPPETFRIPSFRMDRHPVSRGQFRTWLMEIRGLRTAHRVDGDFWLSQVPDSELDRPVSGVPYRLASLYCATMGGRLPTLPEFYAAIRFGGKFVDLRAPGDCERWHELGSRIVLSAAVTEFTSTSPDFAETTRYLWEREALTMRFSGSRYPLLNPDLAFRVPLDVRERKITDSYLEGIGFRCAYPML